MIYDEAVSILNLKNNFSEIELDLKYKELCKKFHPDLILEKKNKKNAEKIFTRINSAYFCLKNKTYTREDKKELLTLKIIKKISKNNLGKKIKIEIEKDNICSYCGGTGAVEKIDCEKCSDDLSRETNCIYCSNKGFFITKECKYCINGKNKILKKIEMLLPKNKSDLFQKNNFIDENCIYEIVFEFFCTKCGGEDLNFYWNYCPLCGEKI